MNPSATEFAFDQPAWLAAAALLLVVWAFSRRSLGQPGGGRRAASLLVGCLLVVFLAMGMAGPRLRFAGRNVCLVVASDVSRSIGEEAKEESKAFLAELKRQARPTRVRELTFPVDSEEGLTDLAAAIGAARAMAPADRVPRIVLLSDGNAITGDTVAAAAAAGCEIDVVPLPSLKREVYVSRLEAPDEVYWGEAFFVDVIVQSLGKAEGRLTLRGETAEGSLAGKPDGPPASAHRNDQQREVVLQPGENRFRFRGLSASSTTMRLAAEISQCPDTLAENNTAAAIVLARSSSILIVDPQPDLAGVLKEALDGGVLSARTAIATPAELPEKPEKLQQYDLLILSNVPATALSEGQSAALGRYVRDLGGGLIVVGGNRAFTAGDYGGTRLEQMLPVEIYVKPDKPKPTLAMLLVLDRSGSMEGAPIDLARQAARQAVDRLTANDQVGILAFEDRMHWIVPLQPFDNREVVLKGIDTIVAGGGTNIYPALDQAYLALRDAETDLKHIILLSDGVSHPGDFDALAQRIAKDGITLSTVGVGGEASEEFLRKIAAIASGQAYFCSDPAEVPRVFELDVMAAGKHGITEEPFRPDVVSPARMFAGLDLSDAPPLLGYVDTRAKPGSQLLLASPSGDPLLAWWRYGRGVSMAFTSDIHRRWAAAWHRWPGFSNFWTRLVCQALCVNRDDSLQVTTKRCGERTAVFLDVVDNDGRWFSSGEVTGAVQWPCGHRNDFACTLVEPGRYVIEVPTKRIGDYGADFSLPATGGASSVVEHRFVVSYPAELRIEPTNVQLLRQIAERSGGRFAPEPAEVLRPAETTAPCTIVLGPWFLVAAIVLLVFNAAFMRLRPR